MRGVNSVENHLETVGEPVAVVPASDEGRSATMERLASLVVREWTPATRVMGGVAGAALATMGLARPRATAALVSLLGVALLVRAVGVRRLAKAVDRLRRRPRQSPRSRRAIDAGTHGIGW